MEGNVLVMLQRLYNSNFYTIDSSNFKIFPNLYDSKLLEIQGHIQGHCSYGLQMKKKPMLISQ